MKSSSIFFRRAVRDSMTESLMGLGMVSLRWSILVFPLIFGDRKYQNQSTNLGYGEGGMWGFLFGLSEIEFEDNGGLCVIICLIIYSFWKKSYAVLFLHHGQAFWFTLYPQTIPR